MMKNKKNLFLLSALIICPWLAFSASEIEYKNLIEKSWALDNQGNPQLFDLDPLQTYQLRARKGEDLNLLPRPSSVQKLKKIKVAVLDTGIDVNHPYLKNKIYRNEKECESNQQDRLQDLDGNGYPGDCTGWSIFGETHQKDIIGSPDVTDLIGHGTHVAGLIASVSDHVQIIPVKVITDAPNEPVKPFSIDLSPSENIRGGLNPNTAFENAERTARGIIYAVNAGADIITMSIGWPEMNDTALLKAAVAQAQEKGIIVLAAAGNDSTESLLRPCQYPEVICVAASKPDGAIAHFSNFGFGVDIAAPGTGLVSTIPMNFRSIRLPGFIGVDILNGTSQATPLVAGVIADLLSRGISASEIYPRLILGARGLKKDLPVLVGPIKAQVTEALPKQAYTRTTLAGLVDATGAYKAQPQPLLLSADKEIKLIEWDRSSLELSFVFQMKNYWADVNFNDVSLIVESNQKSKYHPQVVKYEFLDNAQDGAQDNVQADDQETGDNIWSMHTKREVKVYLKIQDTDRAELSQIASDLSFKVQPIIAYQKTLPFEIRAEIQTVLNKETLGADLQSIPITGQLQRGMKLFLVDEIYDQQIHLRDYLALKQGEQAFDVQLLKAMADPQSRKTSYIFQDIQKIAFEGNIKQTRPVQRIRLDIDFDGVSEYILVIQEYKEKGGLYSSGDYILHFYIFNEQFNLKQKFSFYDERAVMPLNYGWMKVGNELRPAWVINGKPVIKKWDITDLWQTDDLAEPFLGTTDIRLYYLDAQFKLDEVQAPQDSRIVDLIQASMDQVQSGILPVLIAKNLGTEIKPSYFYEFSLGYAEQGKARVFKTLQKMSPDQNYRNLLDTRVDRIHSLKSSDNEWRGTYWFGLDAHKKQRITMIDFKTFKITDRLINSITTIFDSPLLVRAAYMGSKKGVFVMTNSEIEYHDFNGGRAVQTSLNKYTFMGDDLTVNLQFPITIQKRTTNDKFPALFNVAGTLNNRGVKMIMPVFDDQNRISEIIAPARFHLQTPKGCRPQDAPVFLGQKGYALDFYCGDQFLRIQLAF